MFLVVMPSPDIDHVLASFFQVFRSFWADTHTCLGYWTEHMCCIPYWFDDLTMNYSSGVLGYWSCHLGGFLTLHFCKIHFLCF